MSTRSSNRILPVNRSPENLDAYELGDPVLQHLTALYGLICQHIPDREEAEKMLEGIAAQLSGQKIEPTGLFSALFGALKKELKVRFPSKNKSLRPPAALSASGGNVAQAPEPIGILAEQDSHLLVKLIYENYSQADLAENTGLSLEEIRIRTRRQLLKYR